MRRGDTSAILEHSFITYTSLKPQDGYVKPQFPHILISRPLEFKGRSLTWRGGSSKQGFYGVWGSLPLLPSSPFNSQGGM